MAEDPDPKRETYLGDGLYASFDGWQVWLRAPREGGDHRVALEPERIVELVEFIAGLRERFPGQTVAAWEALVAAVRAMERPGDV